MHHAAWAGACRPDPLIGSRNDRAPQPPVVAGALLHGGGSGALRSDYGHREIYRGGVVPIDFRVHYTRPVVPQHRVLGDPLPVGAQVVGEEPVGDALALGLEHLQVKEAQVSRHLRFLVQSCQWFSDVEILMRPFSIGSGS